MGKRSCCCIQSCSEILLALKVVGVAAAAAVVVFCHFMDDGSEESFDALEARNSCVCALIKCVN